MWTALSISETCWGYSGMIKAQEQPFAGNLGWSEIIEIFNPDKQIVKWEKEKDTSCLAGHQQRNLNQKDMVSWDIKAMQTK